MSSECLPFNVQDAFFKEKAMPSCLLRVYCDQLVIQELGRMASGGQSCLCKKLQIAPEPAFEVDDNRRCGCERKLNSQTLCHSCCRLFLPLYERSCKATDGRKISLRCMVGCQKAVASNATYYPK